MAPQNLPLLNVCPMPFISFRGKLCRLRNRNFIKNILNFSVVSQVCKVKVAAIERQQEVVEVKCQFKPENRTITNNRVGVLRRASKKTHFECLELTVNLNRLSQ